MTDLKQTPPKEPREHLGEGKLIMGGNPYILRYSLDALYWLTEEYGFDSPEEMLEKKSWLPNDVVNLILAGLRYWYPDLDREFVHREMAVREVQAARMECFRVILGVDEKTVKNALEAAEKAQREDVPSSDDTDGGGSSSAKDSASSDSGPESSGVSRGASSPTSSPPTKRSSKSDTASRPGASLTSSSHGRGSG